MLEIESTIANKYSAFAMATHVGLQIGPTPTLGPLTNEEREILDCLLTLTASNPFTKAVILPAALDAKALVRTPR